MCVCVCVCVLINPKCLLIPLSRQQNLLAQVWGTKTNLMTLQLPLAILNKSQVTDIVGYPRMNSDYP